MTESKTTEPPQPGDLVTVHGHRVGEPSRTGEILEVIAGEGREHFRVRWEDGHVSVFYPSSDAVVVARHARDPR